MGEQTVTQIREESSESEEREIERRVAIRESWGAARRVGVGARAATQGLTLRHVAVFLRAHPRASRRVIGGLAWGPVMKREELETLLGRPLSNAEWLEVWRLLKSGECHPAAEAVLDRCIERGLSIEATINELSKLSPPS